MWAYLAFSRILFPTQRRLDAITCFGFDKVALTYLGMCDAEDLRKETVASRGLPSTC